MRYNTWSGIGPMSPALAGGVLTTEPPKKSHNLTLKVVSLHPGSWHHAPEPANLPSPTSGAAPGFLRSGRSSWVSLGALSFLERLTPNSPEAVGGEGSRDSAGPAAGCQEHQQCPSLLPASLLFILKFLFIPPLRNALLPFCTTACTPTLPVTSLPSHS